MNNYTASFTDNTTKRKIKLPVVAFDYAKGLEIARAIAVDKNYRFDDLDFKSKVAKIRLTQKMTFAEVCEALKINADKIGLLWTIIQTTNSATLNQSNKCREIVGDDNYETFRKWLYR